MTTMNKGRNSRGQFVSGSDAARNEGRKGGYESSSSFAPGSERARRAGHKGGKAGGNTSQ